MLFLRDTNPISSEYNKWKPATSTKWLGQFKLSFGFMQIGTKQTLVCWCMKREKQPFYHKICSQIEKYQQNECRQVLDDMFTYTLQHEIFE